MNIQFGAVHTIPFNYVLSLREDLPKNGPYQRNIQLLAQHKAEVAEALGTTEEDVVIFHKDTNPDAGFYVVDNQDNLPITLPNGNTVVPTADAYKAGLDALPETYAAEAEAAASTRADMDRVREETDAELDNSDMTGDEKATIRERRDASLYKAWRADDALKNAKKEARANFDNAFAEAALGELAIEHPQPVG